MDMPPGAKNNNPMLPTSLTSVPDVRDMPRAGGSTMARSNPLAVRSLSGLATLCALLLSMAGCGDVAKLPVSAGTGPQPTLHRPMPVGRPRSTSRRS